MKIINQSFTEHILTAYKLCKMNSIRVILCVVLEESKDLKENMKLFITTIEI